MAPKEFVGFGFGPIQSGLMVHEAMRSGNFGRFVVAEIDQVLVDAVRKNGNRVSINVAHRDAVRTETLESLELLNPTVGADRAELARAIHDADEMATAIPSVKFYAAGGDTSIAALLASHINPDKPQLLYASENNNYAAEILCEQIRKQSDGEPLGNLQVLNTVIGKMSGVIRDPALMERLELTPLTPSLPRAVLVEEFNRIYISQVASPGVSRGIEVFEEKAELLPFEEAKLFGHNAIHSLLGYLAHERGYEAMSAIRDDSALLERGRRAFIEECGAALIAKHASLGDRLFTHDGWTEYADDLLERMTNPFLHDAVERICRDPERKLGYDDRLFGTMRVCLSSGVKPQLLARGALAALRYLAAAQQGTKPMQADVGDVRERLTALWRSERDDGFMKTCIELVHDAALEM